VPKELMKDFEDVADGECAYMENSMTTRVMGEENILLKFTFGKLLSLSNVLYMSFLCRNFVYDILLNKASLKNYY